MKNGYTHVSMALDRSGSMESIKSDTIGGVNSFIDNQRKEPGKMTFTLCQFDTEYDLLYSAKDIKEVPLLSDKSFVPRGTTALLDSVCRLIAETGSALAALPEEERPERVIVVIVTDGQENASKKETKESLHAIVKHQEEAYDWHFMYIGANQDAFSEARSMGMHGVNFAADSGGTQALYGKLSGNISKNRAATRGTKLDLTQDEMDEREPKNP